MSLGLIASSEFPAREVLGARPLAERAQSDVERSPASKTLTAHSEPYNRAGLHAQSMTDKE
jgi:hypothetical protein